ncbi:MAG: Rdx family protein, partial [Candidatus Zixiibacteriota bacterium]
MAVAVEKEFGIVANLKEGHGGIFEVALNGRVVFSNLEEGRFPENEEIFQKIREYQGSPDKSTSSARRDDQDAQTPGGESGSGCCCPGGSRGQG